MEFKNLEQRMAQCYIDMFPKFVPDEQATVSVSEQKIFYDLINNLYQLAFDEPLLFVTSLHDDDAYPNRINRASYGKPELQKNMKKFLKEMDMIIENMFLLGQNTVVKFSKKHQVILSRLGINDFTKLPKAWSWMSNRPNANTIAFSHCLFNNDYPYASDIYANLFGEKAFRKIEKWMLGQEYKRFIHNNIIASDCKLTLTYINPLWSKDSPKGGYEYGIRHTGISAKYDFYTREPAVFGLCIPNGLKEFLMAFETMEKKLQGFVVENTKKCDSCRYCVQTDKTGSRPFVYITVKYEQKQYNLCPLIPGYTYCWTSIDNELVEQLISFLSFMDRFVNIRGKINGIRLHRTFRK